MKDTLMSEIAIARKLPVRRILVVEDDPSVADTIRRVLAISGHLVDIVEDAKQALRVFEVGKYDLVITDYALGTMTGLALTNVFKGLSPAQPIILITAYIHSLAFRKDRLSNIDFLLGKPFSLEQMQEALAAVFPVR